MDDPLFVEAPFFLARFPLLPFEIYQNAYSQEKLLHLFNTDTRVKEAIAIASPSLYQAALQFETLNEKRKKQVVSSLFKYLIRMSTRATPFGLFSFVSFGEWGISELDIDLSKVKKRARPDMEWVIEHLDRLISDRTILPFLKLQRNPLLYESMGRIILPYAMRKKHSGEQISIKASPLIRLILVKTKKKISSKKLIETSLSTFSTLEEEKLTEILYTLLEKGILQTQFYPTLLTDNAFEDMLQELKATLPKHSLTQHFEKVSKEVQLYNSLPPGEGEKELLQLQNLMDKDPKTILQVDSYSTRPLFLNKKIAHEVREAVDILWKLSPNIREFNYLRDYHGKFLEKFGSSRIIPFLEVVDELQGIGYPDYEQRLKNEKFSPSYESELLEKTLECLRENTQEIHLTEEFVKKHSSDLSPIEAPSSFDLFCEVLTHSNQGIEAGDYFVLIHSNTGGCGGCESLGRFLDLFGKAGKENVRDFFEQEQQLESQLIFAEASYFPTNPRSANVSMHENLRKKTLDLGYPKSSKSTFDLEDIFIGAMNERLYLTLEQGGVELIATTMNVLNPKYAPESLRLLRDISSHRTQMVRPFYWDSLSSLPFRPRLRYKNTILSPATWQLTLSLLSASQKDSIDILCKKINTWGDKWFLPRFLYLTIADNKLLLDRKDSFHLSEIARVLKTHPENRLTLIEKIELGPHAKSQEGAHFMECIIPFIKNKQYVSPTPKIPSYQPVPFESRYKDPGSEWIFMKLFVPQKSESRFLVDVLTPFIEKIYASLTSWFYIHYQEDQKPHIRLRIKLKNLSDFASLLNELSSHANKWMEFGWLQSYSFSPYERELERYGGENAIEQAEKFFCADSELALKIQEKILKTESDLPDYVLTAFSLMELVKDTTEKQEVFWAKTNLGKKHLKGSRELKPKLLSLIENPQKLFPQELLKKRANSLKNYYDCMEQEKDRILPSLLHMHCNRVLGTSRELEEKALIYASHIFSLFSTRNKSRVS